VGRELSYPCAKMVYGSREKGVRRVAYREMAQSHVKELVRQGTGLVEVLEDSDGDLPFRSGRAMYFISTRSDGRQLKVWSRAVEGVKPTVAVLREVNAANLALEVARVVVRGDDLYVEGVLPVETTTAEDLGRLCREVGTVADELGSLVAAVHGGSTWFSDDDAGCSCGSD
jgi:hypothetical protein